mmetsp:Transcript_21921/g.50006  ORF Transcript_21921/g.50006 Transcript_21921/m.50006 type:complete len:367 (+) Transcript_21921:60-1160(+)
MADERVFNFSAGPTCLPIEVLQEAQQDFLSYKGTGMNVMEMSHRSKTFVDITSQSEKDIRDLLAVPDDYKVFYMQGGATLQFASVPLNLLGSKGKADYLMTGQWGEKAVKECKKFGAAQLACDTKATKYTTITDPKDWKLDPEAAYVHYCANETVNGVEFHYTPEVGDVPLVADMSSNFLSKPIDFAKHTLIYAGCQKNAGPAGNTVVIAKPDALGKELPICPSMLSYKFISDADSMPNTPSCFAIYMMGLNMKYMKEKGGVAFFNELADKKAGMLYDAIEGSDGFYACPVEKHCRSRMNVPFTIGGGDEALEKKFQEEAKKVKLFTLAGHRSVGGIRASLYNGMPMEGVETLVAHMKSFQEENAK